MKIDIYKSLLENFGNRIRLRINKEFLKKLQSKMKHESVSFDMNKKRVLRYLRGDRCSTFSDMVNICDTLNVSKEELFQNISEFKFGKNGNRAKINRNFVINEDVAYFLGLFAGEGTKDLQKQLQITNTDSNILKFVRDFYEKTFNASKKSIIAYVGFFKNEDVSKTATNIITQLRLSEKNMHYRIERFRRKTKVTLCLNIGIYRLVIECLLKELPNIIKNNDLAVSFLRGLVDGEGFVAKSNNRAIFGIGMNESYFLDIAELVLTKSGCKVRRESHNRWKATKDLLIVHARDFEKLVKLNIFRFKKESFKKLIEFNSEVKERHSVRGKMLNKFFEILKELQMKGYRLDTKTISQKTGLSRGHVAFLVKVSEEKGLMHRVRDRQNQCYGCRLTERGNNFMTGIEQQKLKRINLLISRTSKIDLEK